MMHGMSSHMLFVWAVALLLVFAGTVIAIFMLRSASTGAIRVSELGFGKRLKGLPFTRPELDPAGTGKAAHDTVFILPDISNYTRFMTGNRFAFGHAQHIIFSLINAMIDAATKTVELSKLEGDAALFFADSQKHSDAAIGQTVMDIFRAFFQERNRLLASNICACKACTSIELLDLKIFVHRGRAARFKFRGSVDHFGTDVIVLHRLMKNGVDGHRYVMVTDAAAQNIRLSGEHITYHVDEQIADIGPVRATVYEIDDATAAELGRADSRGKTSVARDLWLKLRENIRSVQAELFQKTRSGTS